MRRKYWLISGIFALLIILLVVIIFETSESSVKSSVTLDCEPLPTVIIDPGHGGMDGGAVGCDGTLEKNINLSVSLKFADFLKFAGFNVVLTRTEDISLHNEGATRVKDMKTSDLHNRMKIMESTPNNLFISIHQNQYSEEKYHGAQIFYSRTTEKVHCLRRQFNHQSPQSFKRTTSAK